MPLDGPQMNECLIEWLPTNKSNFLIAEPLANVI